ncbi:hypothetical protein GCM10018962_67890 [Dactylosporangium matsuzakiense]|uniref:Uncharacterized protein n=1 Tax=Dactylosporangium matsuzakiense TaxID=53360 RepID=A0A9W6NQI8_9ACTN|nr:hypothetical protein GCM10017581_080140 [Dactylosporangium matsuzakiense]
MTARRPYHSAERIPSAAFWALIKSVKGSPDDAAVARLTAQVQYGAGGWPERRQSPDDRRPVSRGP